MANTASGAGEFSCSYCGAIISVNSYICSGCGKVCKDKIIKMSGKTPVSQQVSGASARPSKKEAVAPPVKSDVKNAQAQSRDALNVQDGIKKAPGIEATDIIDKKTMDVSMGLTGGLEGGTAIKTSEGLDFTGKLDGLSFDLSELSSGSGLLGFASRRRVSADELPPLKTSSMLLNVIAESNGKFASGYRPQNYNLSRPPYYKLAVLTCMCHDIVRLAEDALGIAQGGALFIKTAGASAVESTQSDVIRALSIAVYRFGVEEILVLNHDDCVLKQFGMPEFMDAMKKAGVRRSSVEISDIKTFVGGFSNFKENIRKTISFIQRSGLIPENIAVHGAVLSMKTGKMEVIVNGYSERIVV